jgi:hypothetical protein
VRREGGSSLAERISQIIYKKRVLKLVSLFFLFLLTVRTQIVDYAVHDTVTRLVEASNVQKQKKTRTRIWYKKLSLSSAGGQ